MGLNGALDPDHVLRSIGHLLRSPAEAHRREAMDLCYALARQIADELDALQRQAAQEGARAEKEGRSVIYIHGRPYVDPGGGATNPPPARLPQATGRLGSRGGRPRH